MVEGRPKRACADGIDYAGTDQVPGWTVREEGEFFFPSQGIRVVENIFEIIIVRNPRERKRMMMMRRTKSLVRSFGLRSLSGRTSFRKPRKDERHFGGATDETRASSLSLSLSLTLVSLFLSFPLPSRPFGRPQNRRRKRWSRKARRIHRRHRRNPRRLRPGNYTPPRGNNRTPEGARKRKTNHN